MTTVSPAALLRRTSLGSDQCRRDDHYPLIDIPEERKQQELRRATNHAGAAPLLGRRARLLALVCCAWLLLGFGLLGLAFPLTDSDQAQAAFLAAILVGNGGPAWTLVLAHWSANQT